jgi:SAM-dependent methyltransferase
VIPSDPNQQSEPRLDDLELGRTIQLLYEAFNSVLAASGNLSPYVPTLESYIPLVVDYAEAFARKSSGQQVYYEPGCGAGHVAGEAARRGMHVICLELDEDLAREASRRLRGNPNVDVVIGDLTSFRPRRVDTVYAYLLPRAVAYVLQQLEGLGAPIVSLDYPAELDDEPVRRLAVLEAGYRRIYVYKA